MDDKLFGHSGLPGCCIEPWRHYEEGGLNRNAPYRWNKFEAAHIFPLRMESLWIWQVDYRDGR